MRGRVWIPLLGVLLAGIVAMQVEVLKLNAATGAALQRTTALQNQRDLLQANVARLADDQRIERLAAQMGMQMPEPSQVKFLSTPSGDPGRAGADIHEPNPAAFLAQLPSAQPPGATPAGTGAPASAVTPPTQVVTPSTPPAGTGVATDGLSATAAGG